MMREDRRTAVDTVCRICGRTFTGLAHLGSHIVRSHHITREQYYNRFFKHKGEGKCLRCGKATHFGKFTYGYNLYCSRTCANQDGEKMKHTRESVRKRFGVDSVLQAKEVIEKVRATSLKRYGVQYPAQSSKVRSRQRETMNERYGMWFTKTPQYREKVQQTSLNRYGTTSPNKSADIKQRQVATLKAHYGERPWTNKAIIEKRKRTNLARYGHESFSQTEEGRKKREQTILQRYGCRDHMHNAEILHRCLSHRKHKLVEDGITYGSTWEYKYAKYLKWKGIKAIYHPEFSLPYEYQAVEHRYFPDFIVEYPNGERRIIEIKGDYLAKEMVKRGTKENAKWQCMVKNKVEVLFGQELINLGIEGIKIDESKETIEAIRKLRKELQSA